MLFVRQKLMKQYCISLVIFTLAWITAGAQNSLDSQAISSIRNSIKEQYFDWMIFSNGTYVVITADSATPNLERKIKEILQEYGKVNGKVLHRSNLILKIEEINGWVVDGQFQGLYTFVSQSEVSAIGKSNPTNEDIIEYAMQKRLKDIKELKIIVKSY
jgi:hypothetical protein